MSRSNPNENITNPATRWFQWNGEEGGISYFDKSKGDKGENVPVPDGFAFLLLDVLSTIKGWHKASKSSIYSNEVKNIKDEILHVKSFKGGEIASGTYESIKEKIVSAGGKFGNSCYIAYYDDQRQLQLGNIMFKGASLGAWFDFQKAHKNDLYKSAIQIKGMKDGKTGSTEFKIPIFHLKEVTPETDAKAKEIDKQFQDYLKEYLGRERKASLPAVAPEAPVDNEPTGGEEPEDDIPF